MKIAILSCFYPFRGGIAQFNANLFNELGGSHLVKAFNFSRQYPGLLFPGKTQYVTDRDNAIKIESTPILDTANPFSYRRAANQIKSWAPDLLIMRYWLSYFAISQGYIAQQMSDRTKVISIVDNVIPHERRFFDTPLTKLYLERNDGLVVLSDAVKQELLNLKPNAKVVTIPHPVYDHFGAKVERAAAQKALGLDSSKKTLLFFGLIRDYKGLDILIDAFSMLDESYQLVIAGESYGSFQKYSTQIENSNAKERIKVFEYYIDDSEVPLFFSAADVTVLPYKTATQSGISAISYHFGVPLITTNVGGLKEAIEKPGTGVVVDTPNSKEVAEGINFFFTENKSTLYKENIERYKEELSWKNFAIKLIEFYNTI